MSCVPFIGSWRATFLWPLYLQTIKFLSERLRDKSDKNLCYTQINYPPKLSFLNLELWRLFESPPFVCDISISNTKRIFQRIHIIYVRTYARRQDTYIFNYHVFMLTKGDLMSLIIKEDIRANGSIIAKGQASRRDVTNIRNNAEDLKRW